MVFKKFLLISLLSFLPIVPVKANEIEVLASTVYLEARGASKREKFLVARTVINRRAHKSFPSSIKKIVKGKKQYAHNKLVNKNSTAYKDSLDAAKKALMTPANPKSILYFHDKSYKKGFEWARPLIKTRNFTFYGDK